MSSVTSCVGGGWFLCFTCLHVPYSTVTLITCKQRLHWCGQRCVHTITITIAKVGPLAPPVKSQTWLMGSNNIQAQPKGVRKRGRAYNKHACHT
jgi:hypothetical protein